MNKFLREPSHNSIRFLYPRFYRVDNLKNDQQDILERFELKEDQILTNIGYLNENLGITTKPYMLWLTFDEVQFDGKIEFFKIIGAYIVDNGEFITFVVYNDVSQDFLLEVFGVNNFDELLESGLDALDEGNTNDLNIRILNVINQLRQDNHGSIQPIKFAFME